MSQHATTPAPRRRRRLAAAAGIVVGGVAASAALALSMNGTLAAFTAQITNTQDTTASGTLVMQEVGGTNTSGATCTSTDANPAANTINSNAATCATINKYGGSTVLYPGANATQTVTMKNTGTVTANTFTLKPGTCTQGTNGAINGSASDFCSKLQIVVTQTVGATSTTITPVNSTATSLAGTTLTLGTLAPGASATYTFSVTLSTAADNTYQGLSGSQPLVWNFSS